MDKLKTDINGGFPLTLDDLRFEQDAIRGAFRGLLNGFKGSIDTFIISGVNVTSAGGISWNVSEGWVCFKGEICKVDAHVATFVEDAALTLIVGNTGPTVQLKNSELQQVWQTRRARIIGTDSWPNESEVANSVEMYSVKRIEQLVKEKVDALVPAPTWVTMNGDMLNQWGVLNSPFPNPAYCKTNGRVYMRGAIAITSESPIIPDTNEPFFQLPVGFRPIVNKTIAVFAVTTYNINKYLTGFEPTWIRIDANTGYCYADTSAILEKEIVLDNVSFEV